MIRMKNHVTTATALAALLLSSAPAMADTVRVNRIEDLIGSTRASVDRAKPSGRVSASYSAWGHSQLLNYVDAKYRDNRFTGRISEASIKFTGSIGGKNKTLVSIRSTGMNARYLKRSSYQYTYVTAMVAGDVVGDGSESSRGGGSESVIESGAFTVHEPGPTVELVASTIFLPDVDMKTGYRGAVNVWGMSRGSTENWSAKGSRKDTSSALASMNGKLRARSEMKLTGGFIGSVDLFKNGQISATTETTNSACNPFSNVAYKAGCRFPNATHIQKASAKADFDFLSGSWKNTGYRNYVDWGGPEQVLSDDDDKDTFHYSLSF